MSTPAERAAVIRSISNEAAQRSRVLTDQQHMPGAGADVFDRTTHWEQRTDDAFAVLESAAVAWRVASAQAGAYPDENPDVIRLGNERDAAEREYQRCRNLRDQARDDLEGIYRTFSG